MQIRCLKVGNRSKLKVRLPPRSPELIDGKAMAVFTKEEHELLVETCRWIIVGKFLTSRPSIDKIRVEFAKTITIKERSKLELKTDTTYSLMLKMKKTLTIYTLENSFP